jgi:hypothetical protein
MAMPATKPTILSTYRTLSRMIKLLPAKQKPEKQLQEVRQTFRKNYALTDEADIKTCIQQAGEKIAYLRIITPKKSSTEGNKRWIYTKDGPVQVAGSGAGTPREGGRVISNFDGKNLDPCSIKTHNSHLKRMGFQNNLHAKGLF